MENVTFKNSFWAEDDNPERTAPLEGDTRADVVIIGAGIVGLSCAHYLRLAGLDVVVLEREHVGYASSGRNFGLMVPILGPWTGNWGGFYPSERWQALHGWMQGRVDEAEKLFAAEGIECEFKRRPTAVAALREEDVDKLKRNVEHHITMGTPARFIDAKDMVEITTFGSFGGMALDSTAVVNPWHMVRGLRDMVLRHGVRLYEGTAADSVESGTQVVVRTPRGRVTAEKAVLALNAFSGQFSVMSRYVLPKFSYALATEPLDDQTATQVGLADDYFVSVLQPSGGRSTLYQRFKTDRRLMCGGAGDAYRVMQSWGPNQRVPSQGFEPMVGSLHAEMVSRYPVLADVRLQAAWGGAECTTSTYMPIFTEDWEHENVIVAIVGNGKGVLGVTVAGRLIQGLVLGRDRLDGAARDFLDVCVGPQDADPKILEAALQARNPNN